MSLVWIWNWRLFDSYVLSQYSNAEVSHGLSPNTWRIGLMPVKIAGSEELCGLRIKTASQMKRSANRYQWSRQMRSKWLGHVLWMKVNRLTKSVHEWNPTGKRSRGWPNTRCIVLYWRGPTTRRRCNKVWKNSRKTTNDTERHCSRQTTVEVPNGGIYGWNLLDDDYLT